MPSLIHDYQTISPRSRSVPSVRLISPSTNRLSNEPRIIRDMGPSTSLLRPRPDIRGRRLQHDLWEERGLFEYEFPPSDEDMLNLVAKHRKGIETRYRERADIEPGFENDGTKRVLNATSSGRLVALSSNRQHRGELGRNRAYIREIRPQQATQLRPYATELMAKTQIRGSLHRKGTACAEYGALDTILERGLGGKERSVSVTGADDRIFRKPLNDFNVRSLTIRADSDSENEIEYMRACKKGRNFRGYREAPGCEEYLTVLGVTDTAPSLERKRYTIRSRRHD